MRETVIEKYLVEQVERRGGETRKLKWIGRRSAQDRLVFLNQKIAFIEVKRHGKKPTRTQERERQRLEKLGALATWVNCHEHVDRVIEFLMDDIDPLRYGGLLA